MSPAIVPGSTWNIAEANVGTFRRGFIVWLAGNAAIWAAFEREAGRVWDRGRRHYSARTIIEHLRHNSALADTGEPWKINGNIVPDLARLYRLVYPERADLFEIRSMPGAER